jgi:hypothetical protein
MEKGQRIGANARGGGRETEMSVSPSLKEEEVWGGSILGFACWRHVRGVTVLLLVYVLCVQCGERKLCVWAVFRR